jgi:glucose/arabinose dehydrogenase
MTQRGRGFRLALLSWGAVLLTLGCKATLEPRAADQASAYKTEYRPVAGIQTPEGFRAVLIAEGFNYPSSMTWDGSGRLYVLESHTVAVPTLEVKIRRIGGDGKLEEVELSGAGAPTGAEAVGIQFHDGWIYLSHEEEDGTWGVSRFRPDSGETQPVLRGIPSAGDHWVNYLAFDREGALYYGVGSATNSGVVSANDPVNQKWIKKRPEVHDLPCRDLVLARQKFVDANPLTPAEGDDAETGAYQAYGSSGATRIPRATSCTSAIYRLKKGAAAPELVAWGFRNPVALAFDATGTLLVGMHGADIRGTRPIRDDPDAIYRVRQGAWYGWPDYSADLLPVTDARYRPPEKFLAKGHGGIEFVIDHAASRLSPPDRSLLVTTTAPHAALGGMTVVPPKGAFERWAGQLLISEMGDFKPTTDAVNPDERAGFQVESVDLATGKRAVFARNRGEGPAQPASRIDLEEGFERPVDVKVGPDGLVYVLDFGVFNPGEKTMKVFPKTGRVYRIEPVAAR